jgi:hypothetical protein
MKKADRLLYYKYSLFQSSLTQKLAQLSCYRNPSLNSFDQFRKALDATTIDIDFSSEVVTP